MALAPRSLQLIGPLGTGDLATVYRATDPDNGGSPVAVAILHNDLSDIDGVIEGLRARVEAVSELVHPGVVVQEGLFSVSDCPALVLELVPGVDLIRLAKVGQTPPAIATAIIRDAAATLEALSGDGWAHGYLSPRRTLLTVSGRVKIAGLGARAGTALVGSSMDAVDRGRIRYTAMERAGGVIDHPGDVYALGAMLSLLLTGTWPRRPEKDVAAQTEVADDAARRIVEDVSGDTESLAALVATCMAGHSQDRPSLAALIDALDGTAADAEELKSWAASVVPGLAGPVLEGLEDLESAESAPSMPVQHEVEPVQSEIEPAEPEVEPAEPEVEAAQTEVDEEPAENSAAEESEPESTTPQVLGTLGPPPESDEKESLAMPPIDVEDLQPISPDDETDLAAEVDTDEPVPDEAGQVQIDPDADQWDRMLGLDVVPDQVAEPGISDQVPQRSSLGLWVILGLAVGLGLVWSMGLIQLPGSPSGAPDAQIEAVPPVQPAPAAEAPSSSPAGPVPATEAKTKPAEPEEVEEVAPVEEAPKREEEKAVAPEAEKAASPELPPVVPLPDPTTPPAEPATASPPTASTPTPPQTGLVRVAGNAHEVRLVLGGRRYSGGRMPPGTYHIEVIFRDGESSRVSGRVSLEAGDKKMVRCDATFYRCTVY